jgi:BirA family biotin operon repressor/biotin-[acetyl-CoA-carboxylase] ligase
MRVDERVLTDLAATTRFADVRLLDSVDSTNRYARDAAASGTPEGLVVVADHQTAGRGRAGRSWDAPPGSGLLLSVLLRPRGLDPARLHLVTAAVGLSAVAALRTVAGIGADLKWPNDLLVGDRKLAGILGEALGVGTGSAGAVVVGIGLNVSAAPPGAIDATEAAGRPVERAALLAVLLRELDGRCDRWNAVAEEYGRSVATVGRRVRVEGPPGVFRTGTASGLDAAGRLLFVDDATGGVTALSVGDVVHLRPAPPGGGRC